MSFVYKKSLGQYFLNNEHVPKTMADTAEVTGVDTVLEIGPGTGVLTRELLRRGATVIAIEADGRAINSLRETFSTEIENAKLLLHHDDIVSTDLSNLSLTEYQYKVVANIPYYLSGKLFRIFLESVTQPSCLVFLTQKEVAERIGRDTKESILSLSVKAYGTPKYIQTVKRGNFSPQPRVDSAILAIEHISHSKLRGIDEAFFFKMLHLGFGSKRKQLLGNLAGSFERTVLTNIFSTLHITPTVRAEDLTLEIWLELVRALEVHR